MATRPGRRSVEVNLGMPADDDARLRREASWSDVELRSVPPSPQAQDPGEPG